MCPARISSAPASTSARQDVAPAGDRALARPPRRADQVVVEHDDTQRARPAPRRAAAARCECASRMPPDWWRHGSHRVEPDDVQLSCAVYTGSVVSQQRSNPAHVRGKRAGEASGMSWFPGIDEHGRPRRGGMPRRGRAGPAARCVRSPRRDHDAPGRPARRGRCERRPTSGTSWRADVEVGDVEKPGGHGRSTL